VALSSFCARTAIADSAIAALGAATKRGGGSIAAPTAGTSKVLKDDWIIGTGNESAGNVRRKRA
jgi:hypothetical protein